MDVPRLPEHDRAERLVDEVELGHVDVDELEAGRAELLDRLDARGRARAGTRSGSSSWRAQHAEPQPGDRAQLVRPAGEHGEQRAVCATVRVSVPTWSHVGESGNTPSTGTRPNVGFRPTIPQYAAGIRIEPPVSVPSAWSHTPAATSAAEPLLDPPDVRLSSRGLNVIP